MLPPLFSQKFNTGCSGVASALAGDSDKTQISSPSDLERRTRQDRLAVLKDGREGAYGVGGGEQEK